MLEKAYKEFKAGRMSYCEYMAIINKLSEEEREAWGDPENPKIGCDKKSKQTSPKSKKEI